jgi:hypothetical protein
MRRSTLDSDEPSFYGHERGKRMSVSLVSGHHL